MSAILIRGGTVVNADRQFRADVLCVEGKVHSVGDALQAAGEFPRVDLFGGGNEVFYGVGGRFDRRRSRASERARRTDERDAMMSSERHLHGGQQTGDARRVVEQVGENDEDFVVACLRDPFHQRIGQCIQASTVATPPAVKRDERFHPRDTRLCQKPLCVLRTLG